jgi:hypothetical protein
VAVAAGSGVGVPVGAGAAVALADGEDVGVVVGDEVGDVVEGIELGLGCTDTAVACRKGRVGACAEAAREAAPSAVATATTTTSPVLCHVNRNPGLRGNTAPLGNDKGAGPTPSREREPAPAYDTAYRGLSLTLSPPV